MCQRGSFCWEHSTTKRKKDHRREKDSGKNFMWRGHLDPLLQNNKEEHMFGPKIILPYLHQGNSSGNNLQRFLYSLIVSLQLSKQFEERYQAQEFVPLHFAILPVWSLGWVSLPVGSPGMGVAFLAGGLDGDFYSKNAMYCYIFCFLWLQSLRTPEFVILLVYMQSFLLRVLSASPGSRLHCNEEAGLTCHARCSSASSSYKQTGLHLIFFQ